MQTANPPVFIPADKLLFIADITGTFVFALEGGLAAIRGELDIVGIMVLAFATALGGGIIRDVLLGATPPASLRDWRYPVTAFAGGALVFFLNSVVAQIPNPLIIGLDAAGLALFAVAGTEKALLYKMNPLIAVLLGTLTGCGGGAIRDVLLAQVPTVLWAEIYATSAFLGAVIMVSLRKARVPAVWAGVVGGIFCFTLRVVSVWRHWNLPTTFPKLK